ncbi:pyrroline-5-carboxylate reductase dimerization-domain-containing protein [Aspergillus aurantiobrunneus]
MSNTLCILGCGNLGTAILKTLLTTDQLFTHYIACVRSSSSSQRLTTTHPALTISTDTVTSIQSAHAVILALDPSTIASVLAQPGLVDALGTKPLISVAAGWTRTKLEETLYGSPTDPSTAPKRAGPIEIDPAHPPQQSHLALADAIFARVGKTIHIPPSLVDATTAVAGSTPAMFAVIVDSMVDAAVAVGVPRALAQSMVFQAMRGTAGMLQAGEHPALLKDQGTSPEGCTIGGLMVLEERGGVGRAVREAVTLARAMDGEAHVNDTR